MAQLPRPAAVDVGTAKEDGASWEDALDVDDSDLRLSPLSSSRPLLSSSTTAAAPHPDKSSRPSHDQRIPGPASAIQDAMRVQDSGVAPFLRRADAQGVDADFVRHPWLCALQFLGKDRAWERPGIKGIKVDRELNRAPLVAGVVTSCKPNGVGDLLLTIKDPTDSIGASAHRKVLSEGNVGQDISVGCVILLHKVAVFRPAHTACYLNVTKGKLVKVVRKDCDPTFEQELSSCIIESQLPVGTWKVTQPVEHLGDKPFGTSEESASIFSKMVSRTNHTQVADLHSEGGTANVCGTIFQPDRSKTVPTYSASQQPLKTCNNKNLDSWQQRQRGSLPVFEKSEVEGSVNVMMARLCREKMMPGHKEMTVPEVSYDHQSTLDSTNNTSAHKFSSSTYGNLWQSFNITNTCSQPIPGASSVTPGDRACSQSSNNEKVRLPLADEIMLPSSKKPKTNAVLPDFYGTTMNTSLDTKNKHSSGKNMDIDVHNMAEPFHGGHSSISKPDDHERKDFCTANTGTAQPTKETSASDANANNGTLLSQPKRMISVAPISEWTDEQMSELFTDY